MNAIAAARRLHDDRPRTAAQALAIGLALLAVYHVALALFMAIGPHAFYKAIGPFGPYNEHYIRDTATFNAALGAGFAVALVRSAWRVPVLAVTTVQFALHTLNHLLDVGDAHPAWTGWFDFLSLGAATLVLAWLLTLAHARGPLPSHPQERSSP
jgi:hypothetical protein